MCNPPILPNTAWLDILLYAKCTNGIRTICVVEVMAKALGIHSHSTNF